MGTWDFWEFSYGIPISALWFNGIVKIKCQFPYIHLSLQVTGLCVCVCMPEWTHFLMTSLF